jgi:hypothetical protein
MIKELSTITVTLASIYVTSNREKLNIGTDCTKNTRYSILDKNLSNRKRSREREKGVRHIQFFFLSSVRSNHEKKYYVWCRPMNYNERHCSCSLHDRDIDSLFSVLYKTGT